MTAKINLLRRILILLFFLITACPLSAKDCTLVINTDKPVGIFYDFWSTSVETSEHQFIEPGFQNRVKNVYPNIEQKFVLVSHNRDTDIDKDTFWKVL